MSESTNPIRLGVIGAGWFASRRHLPDARRHENIEIAALCRRDPDGRAKMAAAFGVPAEGCFGDWQEMLSRAELDAVLIATPNNLHAEQARAALEAGCHVLVEKPMTICHTDALELVALAQEKQRHLAVALNPPYWAHCHRIRRALAKPEMGELESAGMYWTGSAEYVFGKAPAPDNLPGVVPPTMYRADPEQNGGGYFIDGGSHLVSEILWVTGKKAVSVTAIMDSTPTDMRASLIIQLEGGAIVTINSIGDSKYKDRRVRNIFGAQNGTINVEGFDFDTTIRIHGQEQVKFREDGLPPIGTPIGNLADAILGKAQVFSPGQHGADVVAVVEAAYLSASTGVTIAL
jgi:predicted dehydrogenase